MITEAEILDQLRSGIAFPPLQIRVSQTGINSGCDTILDVQTAEQTYQFAAVVRARNTPRIFEDSLRLIEQSSSQDCTPVLVVPYLRDRQLEELQKRQLSGIDLCGNGIVCVPNKLLVYRTGQPNQYPDSAPTKYAYRGTTSLVARAFLCRNSFTSLAQIETEIKSRGGNIAISTISKALKRLESDLIVDRTDSGYSLRQPDKLLEQLFGSYRDPRVTRTVTCSLQQPLQQLLASVNGAGDLIFTGRSSVGAYAVMGRDEWPVLYTTSIDRVLEKLGPGVEQTTRFVELELRQTTDSTVYFDPRTQDLPYASPVQTFLELSAGDKREREVAEQVRTRILQEASE